ncbi:MAG: alkylglycerol monooxygenase [Halieaceae bacterium]|jgi:alkylglycerol monooxygenase
MNLIIYAVPFFLFAILVELAYGHWKQRNTYRLNDSVSSLFLGILSQARRFVTLGIGGYIYFLLTGYFSLSLMASSYWVTWVLAFVLYDFCYYWLHRLGHERIILWASHVAHHQSEDYNLSTALRQTSTGWLFSWLFYIPMYLLGIPAEVVVIVGSLNLIYQFWVHSEHIPKLGWYEWFFVTPSNHRVHHAQNDIYMDRNYGGVFVIWDRLFGSFQEELDEAPCVYGIRGPLRSLNPVKAITHIYVDIAKDSWYANNWRDKLRVWVARTGWRPADVEERYPRPKHDLSSFEKYDPAASAAVKYYAFFQLLAAAALLSVMESMQLGYFAGVALWALVLATTVTTASWLEDCDNIRLRFWETVRLGSLGILLISGVAADFNTQLLVAGLAYGLANIAGLFRLGRSAAKGELPSAA